MDRAVAFAQSIDTNGDKMISVDESRPAFTKAAEDNGLTIPTVRGDVGALLSAYLLGGAPKANVSIDSLKELAQDVASRM